MVRNQTQNAPLHPSFFFFFLVKGTYILKSGCSLQSPNQNSVLLLRGHHVVDRTLNIFEQTHSPPWRPSGGWKPRCRTPHGCRCTLQKKAIQCQVKCRRWSGTNHELWQVKHCSWSGTNHNCDQSRSNITVQPGTNHELWPVYTSWLWQECYRHTDGEATTHKKCPYDKHDLIKNSTVPHEQLQLTRLIT